MTPEGKVKAVVKRELQKLRDEGFTVYSFMPVQNGMGAPALDFYVCIDGLFVAIETKAQSGKLTPRQNATANAIKDAGGFVIIARNQAGVEFGLSFVKKEARHRAARLKAWNEGSIRLTVQ